MKADSSDSQQHERFHVVVQNYNKLRSFVDNFDSMVNFDPSRDKVSRSQAR
jgi:hypothetical protein